MTIYHRILAKKSIAKLLSLLLIINSIAFTDALLNQSYATPTVTNMNINATDTEISVSGTGDGNGAALADKPFRYTIGPSQSEWVRDASNITINESFDTGTLNNVQSTGNLLTLNNNETIAAGGLTGFPYRKIISIDHNKIDQELIGFPVNVFLNNNNFDFSKSKPDGSDIRFTDQNLNPLPFVRKEYNLNKTPPTYTFDSTFPSEITNVGLDSMTIQDGKLTLSDSYNAANTDTSQYANLNCSLSGDFEVSVDLTESMIGQESYLKNDGLAVVTSSGKVINLCFYDAWTWNISYPAFLVSIDSTELYYSKVGYFRSPGKINFKIKRTNGVMSFYTSNSANAVTTYSNNETINAIRLCTIDTVDGYSYEPAKFDNLIITGTNPNCFPNASTGQAGLFDVLIPRALSNTDTEFYMWYGNLSASDTSIGSIGNPSSTKTPAWIKAESYSTTNSLLTYSAYPSSGTRESSIYDVSGYVSSSRVQWMENKPAGTNVVVESNVSLDGGSSWLGWKPCTNGGPITDLSSSNSSNARLKVRQTLSTSNGSAPQVSATL